MKIELKHICKKFPDGTPLTDLNAVINDGDIVAVIGPSGTGKSTLLRCINLIDPPTSGEVYIDGLEIAHNKANFAKVRKKMGMVFQSYNLFGHLTVIENVMFPLTELKRMPKQRAYDIAIEKLKSVGLADKALKFPEELSGGQKQRVSIARTIAMDPELILLDEPTSALDPTMVREVESVILKLAKTGKTMMIVTHEMRLAKAISNRVFYLDKGVLYEEGTPDEIFDNPKRERTKAFINHLKVFKYRFSTGDFSYEQYCREFAGFMENNELDKDSERNLGSALEGIATRFVPKYMEYDMPVSIVAEYSPDESSAKLLLYCKMPEGKNVEDFCDILTKYSSQITASKIDDADFDRKIEIGF